MAERQRARLRDKGAQVVTESHYGAAKHMTLMICDHKSLDEMSRVYLNNPRSLETWCYKPVPEDWKPPEGVMFMEQYDRDFYVMCSVEHFNHRMTPTPEPVRTAPSTQEQRKTVLSVLDKLKGVPTSELNPDNIPDTRPPTGVQPPRTETAPTTTPDA